jgi:photosystem II stability/assembly factor-like uncharacterized protein/phage pi2 protein 07
MISLSKRLFLKWMGWSTCGFLFEGKFQKSLGGMLDEVQGLETDAGWQLYSTRKVVWEQIAMGASGTCDFILAHPDKPDYVFMSNDSGSSYYSIDGGNRWRNLNGYDGFGDELSRIRSMAFCLSKPEVGYLTNQFGIWKSTDYGLHWKNVNKVKDIGTIAVDPKDSQKIECGPGNNRHYLHSKPVHQKGFTISSHDGGVTLTEKKKIHPDAIINKILFDPNVSKDLSRKFIATTYGFYVCPAGGKCWIQKNNGLPHNHCLDLSLSTREDGKPVLYLSLKTVLIVVSNQLKFSGGIYKSEDGGETWKSISDRLYFRRKKMPKGLLDGFEKWLEKERLIVKTGNSLPLSPPEKMLHTFDFVISHPTKPDVVYVGTWMNYRNFFDPHGIWKSVDGGTDWMFSTRKGYGWIEDAGYWMQRCVTNRAENITYSWIRDKKSITDRAYNILDPRSFSMCRSDPMVLYFATKHAVYKTDDAGFTWRQVDCIQVGEKRWRGRGNSNIHGFRVYFKPNHADTVYLVGADVCLWKSEDGGDSLSAPCLDHVSGDCEALAFGANNSEHVYMAKSRGKDAGKVFFSDSGGVTFHYRGQPFPKENGGKNAKRRSDCIHDLVFNPDSGSLFACGSFAKPGISFQMPIGTGKGVAVSHDGGRKWRLLNDGLGTNRNVFALALTATPPRHLYAAVLSCVGEKGNHIQGGLFRAKVGVGIWRRLTLPKPVKHVNAVSLDPSNQNIFYIACGNINTLSDNAGGVFQSLDGGVTWKQIFQCACCLAVGVSPHDSNMIFLSSGSPWMKRLTPHPGVYLSNDRGKTWEKVNQNLVQATNVVSFTFHPQDPARIWCGTRGGGWHRGAIEGMR